jgi:hypothetical protein
VVNRGKLLVSRLCKKHIAKKKTTGINRLAEASEQIGGQKKFKGCNLFTERFVVHYSARVFYD